MALIAWYREGWRWDLIRLQGHGNPIIIVALQRHRVRLAGIVIHPKTTSPLMPLVRRCTAILQITRTAIKPPAIHPVIYVLANAAAGSGIGIPALMCSRSALDQNTLCVLRLLCDDVDNAVYGIGAPDCGPRTAN